MEGSLQYTILKGFFLVGWCIRLLLRLVLFSLSIIPEAAPLKHFVFWPLTSLSYTMQTVGVGEGSRGSHKDLDPNVKHKRNRIHSNKQREQQSSLLSSSSLFHSLVHIDSCSSFVTPFSVFQFAEGLAVPNLNRALWRIFPRLQPGLTRKQENQ